MEILEIKVMKGPNYWSVRRHNLIVMLLDIGEMEQRPSNTIPGFLEHMKQRMPSLYAHRCSEGVEGGFFSRVERGTWMGHIVEHVALELQSLAGMEVGFGRTRQAEREGVYNVVFTYYEAKAGIHAGREAVAFVEALIKGEEYDVDATIQRLREIREEERLGPSTGSIVEEAVKRKIPWIRLNRRSLVQLGYGKNQKRIQATVASTTSNIAVEIACDKEDTKQLLEQANVPTPKGVIVRQEEDIESAIRGLRFPLVTKPLNGNHGRGATTNLQNLEEVIEGFRAAQKHSRSVIIERFLVGYDFRALVINYKFVAAARRTPAAVTGDGNSTIEELIAIENQNPKRGYGHENVLTRIDIDPATLNYLSARNLTPQSVPAAGEEVWLKPTANLSTGGTSTDVTDYVHPSNVILFERIARLIGLDICGIDVIAQDLSTPLVENGGGVIEVNAGPGFRMHLDPAEGLPRNVAEPVIDMLYPPGSTARIPILAVTGTNGKTTTTRLLAHIMKQTGATVGFNTTDGIYIQNELMMTGDCTGPFSAEFILKDPTVDIAVLECARGGLLRSGLGFHNCDVAVVTNVGGDHLGLGGIDTIEKLAKVKSVVPKTVFKNGYAILNADDDHAYEMKEELECNIALFSLDENNPRIRKHIQKNRLSAVYENGFITIMKGSWKIRLLKVSDVPITFNGAAEFNIYNVLGAVLAAYVSEVTIDNIRVALQTFIPSPAMTPGRMNMFNFANFKVMLDYAHNTHGMKAIGKFVSQTPADKKIGIIAGVGDRRDEDTIDLGEEAARSFDEIIIRQDKHLRGRTSEEIVDLLRQGIESVSKEKKITVILDETEAIDYAISHAQNGDFITIISDVIPNALDRVKYWKQKELEEVRPSESAQ